MLIYAQIITALVTIAMLVCLFSPIAISIIYLFIRPLVQPLSVMNFTIGNGIPLTSIFSFVLIASIFINIFFRNKYIKINTRLIPLYLLLLLSTLSFLHTPQFFISIGGVVKLMTAISLYGLIYLAIRQETDVRTILIAYVLCSILPMVYGYYQYFTCTGHAWKGAFYASKRIDSVLMEWNAYGEFLCINLAACIMLFKQNNNSLLFRNFLILLMTSMIISLILSLNRGSWICMSVGIVIGIFSFRSRVKLRKIIIIGILISFVFGSVILQRFNELNEVNSIGMSHNTFEGRIEGWKLLIPLILNHPIVGNGADVSLEITRSKLGVSFAPHNDYLRMALEIGIPGAILYILFLAKEVLFAWRQRKNENTWSTNLGMFIITMYFFLLSIFQNIYTNMVVFPMFMGLLAVGHKYNYLKKNKQWILS